MPVRPFTLTSRLLLDQVAARLLRAAHEWRDAWGLAEVGMKVSCVRATEYVWPARGPEWHLSARAANKEAWFCWPAELPRLLQRRLFAPDAYPVLSTPGLSMADASGHEAVRALAKSVAGIAQADGLREWIARDTAFDAAWAYGAGGVVASVQLEEQMLVCLLNRDFCAAAVDMPVQRISAGQSPLRPFREALAPVPIRLALSAGDTQIDVRSFLSLAPGDVIRLERTLTEPLLVRGPDGRRLFDAYPGKMDAQIAAEVVRQRP
jgi:flagellar motor switch/type III secretory pathway protein FliN